MMTRHIAVVSAGLSSPSSTRILADQLASAVEARLFERGEDVRLHVIELREHARALADNLLTGFPSGALAQALQTVADADAVIAVTPVFSASYSGLFKTFFDVLEPGALEGKPVLMGATAGTARHSLVLDHALRPLFSYLKATPVPTGVFAASEDFGSNAGGRLAARVDRAAAELVALLDGPSARADVPPARKLQGSTEFDPDAAGFLSFDKLRG
ncbi:NADPH-dependent FMN reductase [Nocardioides jejuensis]|uniref:NADPH-dependent FMN reductase n=2 Tax=Nocardioides jejuensis TaxID=2502782 RepID=A0A4R1CHP2_9ACTN|nr:NADPH-dependent FMN reductase [Nocardioides jejuensis]